MIIAYLQHGKPPGPFRTERVEVRQEPAPKRSNRNRGSRLETDYMVKDGKSWKRVYAYLPYNMPVSGMPPLFVGMSYAEGIAVTLTGIPLIIAAPKGSSPKNGSIAR